MVRHLQPVAIPMIRFVPLLAVLCLPAPLLAQDVLPSHLASMMERRPDLVMRAILDDFLGIAPDGRLTPDDMAYAEAVSQAEARAKSLIAILVHDLDGDGAISTNEVAAHRRHAAPDVLLDLELILAERDGDGDGALSAAEVAAPDPTGDAGPYRPLDLDYLAMDLDGDGEVVTAEVVEAVRRMAAEEPAPAAEEPAPAAEEPVVCAYPVPSAEAEIVLLSGSEANLLSPVTLTGQDGITMAGTIVIEEGATPLYIIALADEPMVWQLEGATGRVEALVLPDHLGAAGLPRDRVAFLAGEPCQPDLSNDPVTARRSMIRLENALGRAPDGIVEVYDVGRVTLPSGANETLDWDIDDETFTIRIGRTYVVSENPERTPGTSAALIVRAEDGGPVPPMGRAMDLVYSFPGGVAAIAPTDVVAARPVETYAVLPGAA
jgi:hypothetical protein